MTRTPARERHVHDLGLSHDLPTVLSRRRALALLGGGLGLAALSACGQSTETPLAGAAQDEALEGRIPEETAGPFPANGTNGVNALTESGIVRADITRNFGGASGVAIGVPLTVRLRVLALSAGGAPLAGAAVYLWHCDSQGRYSLYDKGVEDENYLRGVQAADGDGVVTFTTVFPGAYPGRWPHMHFEVYPDIGAATSASTKLRTSQLALPEDVSAQAYASEDYPGSTRNLAGTSLDSDNVFRDGYSLQLATVTGTVAGGLTAALTVPV